MELLASIKRWADKIERSILARRERVAAVAEYEARHEKFLVFFIEDGNNLRHCRLLRRFGDEAETNVNIIQDGLAWCQTGALPKRARPMDTLPSNDESSRKRYR